jgi:hypothetical protein
LDFLRVDGCLKARDSGGLRGGDDPRRGGDRHPDYGLWKPRLRSTSAAVSTVPARGASLRGDGCNVSVRRG